MDLVTLSVHTPAEFAKIYLVVCTKQYVHKPTSHLVSSVQESDICECKEVIIQISETNFVWGPFGSPAAQ